MELAVRVAIADGHAVADQAIEVPVVLKQGACEIVLGQLGDGILDSVRRQMRVEAVKGPAQVASEDDFAGSGAACSQDTCTIPEPSKHIPRLSLQRV